MYCRISDMRCKEVINTSDGLRLGFVCDVCFNTSTGRIESLIIPGEGRFFGLFGHRDDYVIPWECIRRVGDDIILIEVKGEYKRERYGKR